MRYVLWSRDPAQIDVCCYGPEKMWETENMCWNMCRYFLGNKCDKMWNKCKRCEISAEIWEKMWRKMRKDVK